MAHQTYCGTLKLKLDLLELHGLGTGLAIQSLGHKRDAWLESE